MASFGIEGRSAGNNRMTGGMTGMATVSVPAAVGTKGGGAVMGGRAQYQGGSSFTVFSAQGSNPLVNCKLCGKGIQKVYDKSVKGYVYSCTGAHSSKIQLPKDDTKTGLQLIHPYLVLQLFVPTGHHFNLELRVSDTTNTRRKMYFSTSFSELKTTPLHCQIPISMVVRNVWLSLALHVPDLFYNCFRVISFRSVEVIVLGPVCKLRKIFTLRNRLAESGGGTGHGIEETLPQEHMFASGVEAVAQVIDMAKLQSALGIEIPNLEGFPRGGPDSVLSARKLTLNKLEYPRQVHVAFGSRMPLVASTAQNAPANEEKVEKVVKEKQGKTSQEPSVDSNKSNEKVDRKTPQIVRSATPDVKKGENNGVSGAVEHFKGEKKVESNAVQDVESKSGSAKSGKPVVKKKEEQVWKREGQPASAVKHGYGRKEAELVKAKDFRQQARYEDSPPITPCGWERCTSARDSDDMNFKVHTLFEKLGEYGNDDTEVVPSLSEDGDDKVEEADNELQQEGVPASVKQVNPLKEQLLQQEVKRPREKDNREGAEGLTFYQFELEKDFMLREERSASGSDDDLSWCSGSSGRGSPNVLHALEDLVKKSRLTSSEEKFAGSDVNREDVPADASLDSTDFVVHEQDHSSMNLTEALEQEDSDEYLNEPEETFDPEMVAKPVLKLDRLPTPTSARKISPGPSSSRRKSIPGQAEELYGRTSADDGTSEDDLDLLYDPTLDCYYDPKTNRYYELK